MPRREVDDGDLAVGQVTFNQGLAGLVEDNSVLAVGQGLSLLVPEDVDRNPIAGGPGVVLALRFHRVRLEAREALVAGGLQLLRPFWVADDVVPLVDVHPGNLPVVLPVLLENVGNDIQGSQVGGNEVARPLLLATGQRHRLLLHRRRGCCRCRWLSLSGGHRGRSLGDILELGGADEGIPLEEQGAIAHDHANLQGLPALLGDALGVQQVAEPLLGDDGLFV